MAEMMLKCSREIHKINNIMIPLTMKPQTPTLVLGHLVKARKYIRETTDLHVAEQHNARPLLTLPL